MKAGPTERGFSWWSHYLFDRPEVKTFIFPSSSVKRENERFKVSCPQVACVQTSPVSLLPIFFWGRGHVCTQATHKQTSLSSADSTTGKLTQTPFIGDSFSEFSPRHERKIITFMMYRRPTTVQQNKDVKWTQMACESTCKWFQVWISIGWIWASRVIKFGRRFRRIWQSNKFSDQEKALCEKF